MESLFVFATICIIANASPGPAVFLAMRNGSQHGLRAACIGIFGNVSAMLSLALLSAAGIGTIVMSSPWMYNVIKVAGGAYLIYLGIHVCRARIVCCNNLRHSAQCRLALFKEAFAIGISNPKSIAFYAALFPQAINSNLPLTSQFLMLFAICASISCSFLLFYAASSSKISSQIQSLTVRRWFNRISGTAFIGFGVMLMAAQ